MTTKATLEINLKDTVLNDVTADIRNVTRFGLEISAVFHEFSQGAKTVNRTTVNDFADEYSRKLAIILEKSMNAGYKTDVGLLYGSLIDRIACSGQAAFKSFAFARRTADKKYVKHSKELNDNIQRLFSLMTNLTELEDGTGRMVYPDGR